MIPSLPVILLAGAAVAAGSFLAGSIHGGDKVRAAWDKDKAQRVQAALTAEQEARRIEAERASKAQEIVTHAQAQVRAARRDAAAASAAAGGLLDAARAAADRAAACDSAATGRSAADSLADVFADMERAGRSMAAEADAAVIAGQACEAAYGALVR